MSVKHPTPSLEGDTMLVLNKETVVRLDGNLDNVIGGTSSGVPDTKLNERTSSGVPDTLYLKRR